MPLQRCMALYRDIWGLLRDQCVPLSLFNMTNRPFQIYRSTYQPVTLITGILLIMIGIIFWGRPLLRRGRALSTRSPQNRFQDLILLS